MTTGHPLRKFTFDELMTVDRCREFHRALKRPLPDHGLDLCPVCVELAAVYTAGQDSIRNSGPCPDGCCR
jgi:hypothetical protein